MSKVREGQLLWKPSKTSIKETNIYYYMNWLKINKNLHFNDYYSLWKWSVHELEQFWESLWEYFDILTNLNYDTILSSRKMPGAKWFPGATINYAEHIFRNLREDMHKPAIIHSSEMRGITETTWKQLYADTTALQHTLKNLGVRKGDRVVAYVANIYETVVSFLATASIGAIWSSASPDFGTQSVIDRFKQIDPKVMITIDGYSYYGKPYNRMEVVENIQKELPSLTATIVIPFLQETPNYSRLVNAILWSDATKYDDTYELTYEYVSFNDPLWVLFSSGTTGNPKPIVQSQGGILLEHLKAITFHMNLNKGDRFFWYTTTGWMMWNFLIGGLLARSTIILYDGSPIYPNRNSLWELAEKTKMNIFGTSASYLTDCMKHNVSPGKSFYLNHLKCISSTGSPLPPEGFKWCYDNVKNDLWIASISGGTDVCTAFILGAPTLPVHAGELQCRGLGAKVESFTDEGKSKIGEVGELVLTEPLPSMPIYFWNDDGGVRLRESYFDVFPNVWRHGDYLKITDRHTCVIYGRSDATINRGGIRIGTSEIYRAVDQVNEIVDSLIVDIPLEGGDSIVPLFVVMKNNMELSDEIQNKIKQQIREQCSPRHSPTHIYKVNDLPKTLNGKKLEIPVKKILMGEPIDSVVNKDSLANPAALQYFIDFAQKEFG